MFSSILNYCLKKKWITPYYLHFLLIFLAFATLAFSSIWLLPLPYLLPIIGLVLFGIEGALRLVYNIGSMSFLEQWKQSRTLSASRDLFKKAENSNLSELEARWLLMPGLFRNAADFTAGVKVPRTDSVLHLVVSDKNYALLALFCEFASKDDICRINIEYKNILHIALKEDKSFDEKILNFITTLEEFPRLLEQNDIQGNTPLKLAERLIDKPAHAILKQAIKEKKLSDLTNSEANNVTAQKEMTAEVDPNREKAGSDLAIGPARDNAVNNSKTRSRKSGKKSADQDSEKLEEEHNRPGIKANLS